MQSANSSPGVYTVEKDLSQRVRARSTTINVVVGEMNRGPVGQATFITSEDEYLSLFGNPDPKIGWAGHCALYYLQEGNQLYVTRVAPEAVYGGCVIYWSGTFNRSRVYDQGAAEPWLYPLESNDLFTVYPANPGDWNNDMYIRVYPDVRTADAFFYLEVYQRGNARALETFRCHLNMILDGNGRQSNVESQINARSQYIKITQNRQAAPFTANPNARLINSLDTGSNPSVPGIQLAPGANGRRPTLSEISNAWDLYEDKESVRVTMLCDSGYCDPDLQTRIDEICQSRMDCVGIFSVPYEYQTVQKAVEYRRSYLMLDSNYSAIYSSWLIVQDKFTDSELELPPTGHITGVYAKTDRERASWWAPAGMDRGDLKIAGVSQVYDLGMRNALYESQINAIRVIEGAGIKVMGADTLQIKASALSNMSVRRLMIFIEVNLEDTLRYSVFDPNNLILRSRLTSTAETFLQLLKDDGSALYDYGVVCDESNNTPATIAAGDLNLRIYCDPVLPIKRINFNAIVNRTGVTTVALI